MSQPPNNASEPVGNSSGSEPAPDSTEVPAQTAPAPTLDDVTLGRIVQQVSQQDVLQLQDTLL